MKEIADKVFGVTPRTFLWFTGGLFSIFFSVFTVYAKADTNEKYRISHQKETKEILEMYRRDQIAVLESQHAMEIVLTKIATVLQIAEIETVSFD